MLVTVTIWEVIELGSGVLGEMAFCSIVRRRGAQEWCRAVALIGVTVDSRRNKDKPLSLDTTSGGGVPPACVIAVCSVFSSLEKAAGGD